LSGVTEGKDRHSRASREYENIVVVDAYQGGRMVRIIAFVVLLCGAFYLNAMAVPMPAAQAECTRADLQAKVDRYLDALKKGKASLMPLAPEAKYIENRKEIPFGQGAWKEPIGIDLNRSLLDVETCETFTEIIHATGSHQYVIGTRLKVSGNEISEVEALVTDNNDWLFGACEKQSGDTYEEQSTCRNQDFFPII
jgi:hypothetical protein